MSSKKDKLERGQHRNDKLSKKQKEQNKMNRLNEHNKSTPSKEANMKGIKNILKIQEQSSSKILSKKSSKKHLESEEPQTKEIQSPRQIKESPTPNRSLKKQNKMVQEKQRNDIKLQIEDKIYGKNIKKEIKEMKDQVNYQNSYLNYSLMKSQSSKVSQKNQSQQILQKFDFIEIDGLRLNQKSQLSYRVLLENKVTKEQAHFSWKKRQLIPICRIKKRNLIYDYYIKLMAGCATHKFKGE